MRSAGAVVLSETEGPRTTVSIRPLLDSVGDFNQVAVGIAQINGAQFPDGSHAIHRAFFNVNFLLVQGCDDLLQRRRGQEAEIGGAGRGMGSLGVELVAALVQVDLLNAKGHGLAAFVGDDIHAQDFRIEVDGCVQVRHSQNEVVKMLQYKGHMRTMLVPNPADARTTGAAWLYAGMVLRNLIFRARRSKFTAA